MANPIKVRLNRFLAEDGKCFDVAIDHGFFNEGSFLGGIEDMKKAISAVVEANPDAVQLSPGEARILQELPGKKKPSLVLRTDVANVYGSPPPEYLFSVLIQNAVLQAVQLDAACVCVNLLKLVPDDPKLEVACQNLYRQCVENVCALKVDCDKYGMPLMVEPLVMRIGKNKRYEVEGNINLIMPLVRQAVELGADVIKADPSDDISQYHKVIEVASPKPVLVRGGGKASEEEILKRTYDLMKQGAKGIVYGRNVIQHASPTKITKAFLSIVHDGADPASAQEHLK